VPDSIVSSRHGHDAPRPAVSGDGGEERALRNLALTVLCSLPAQHQQYLFGKIRRMCHEHLHRNFADWSDIVPDALVRQVYTKLIGAIQLPAEDDERVPSSIPKAWRKSESPEQDGRVAWLVDQVASAAALTHRCEEIRKERHGRAVSGGGRRRADPSGDKPVPGGETQLRTGQLLATDMREIWLGLLATAEQRFPPDSDRFRLLQVLASRPDTFDDGGSQWPVERLIELLDARFSPPPWSRNRLDDAKRGLVTWVQRVMRDNGLDAVGLQTTFARVARKKEPGKTSA
jgi:hypothetical protein